ncbi:MAG: hypothetical protein JSS61_01295 [Verrucomicrobia bacterium]|nr:hypothetical protein [Verrucomicrobiota bacterium]
MIDFKNDQGIICGCDAAQEWLLPWWWERYSAKNAYPVTFIDFGMSEKMRRWCKEHGNLETLEVDSAFVRPLEELDPKLAENLRYSHGKAISQTRSAWFRKPFACLLSPYAKTLWIDLDCEVLGSLEGIFEYDAPVAMVREYSTDSFPPGDPRISYNGGVILFERGAPLIEKWAQMALHKNHEVYADDLLLSQISRDSGEKIVELPYIYNWRLPQGMNLLAVILHWFGPGGKTYIREYGGLKPALDTFYAECR